MRLVTGRKKLPDVTAKDAPNADSGAGWWEAR